MECWNPGSGDTRARDASAQFAKKALAFRMKKVMRIIMEIR